MNFAWILTAFLVTSVSAALSAAEDTGMEVDLYALSDAELEEICTVRGFELVKDTEEGAHVVFTHDDYVEAARQCLAIERDMEEIIAENPEILAELEEERDRMNAEKERLEKELAQGRAAQTNETHAAFIPHEKTKEEHHVIDLDEDSEFDVIGHQEPLSDTRVHEEELLSDETRPPLDSTKDETLESITSDEVSTVEEGQLGFLETQKAILLELRERIARDFTKVADVVFPKPLRGPARAILRSALSIAKKAGTDLSKFLMRYAKVLVETLKNRATSNEDDEDAAEDAAASPGQDSSVES